MEYQGSWEKNFPWAEFSYNNSYQESIKIAPFEVLYGHRCHSLLNWIEPGEKVIFRPDTIEEGEMIICRIQDNLKARKSRQETYANKRCQPLEFQVGDHVYFWVSPMKGVKRFGVKGKLAPCYIGPFPIPEKCGTVVYELNLPPFLAGVHNIFHVLQLNKLLTAPVDIVLPEVTLLEADLSYPEHPIKVLHQKDRVTRHKQSSSSRTNGATTLKKKKLGKARTFSILAIQSSSYCRGKRAIVRCSVKTFLLFKTQDEISCKGEAAVTP
jgi:hypothetical protein